MLKVGLTGSIAVGKSFVSSVLVQLGCHVIDSDVTAREVVAVGSIGLRRLVEAFGKEILQGDGALDRTRLGEIVFANEEKRQLLNSTLHPLIFQAQDAQMKDWEAEDPDRIVVIDAALMIETKSYKRFDKIIVVHCRPEIQLKRLIKRNGLAPEDAERRVGAQMPQEEKMKFADYLIDTSESFEKTRKRIEEVYAELRALVQSS